MNKPMPTENEMNAQYFAELSRMIEVLEDPISTMLNDNKIGVGMPPRVAAIVACHGLMASGVAIAAAFGVPKEAVLGVIQMLNVMIESPDSPFVATAPTEPPKAAPGVPS